MIVGMDFGTTNTGAATFDGKSIHLLPLDPASSTPSICRTSIYITRSRDYYLGSTALNLYFNQNVGRPTRYKKIKVGEIIQVFAELPTFYRDVFVYEDEFSPGRLFLSIKTALRNPSYYGTVFLENWYSASDLAAIFLMGMKLRIDKYAAAPVEEVVLGRPVHFSNDPDEDKIAQSRLLDAAFKAGFRKVYLEYEPVAAALSYERTIKGKEVILVFDFGGGTLDFTIMEVGDPASRPVLATGGIPVAGDIFDQRLFRATIPKHLGEGDYFRSLGSRYPIPAHIFDQLSSPQEVLSLNTPENLEMLRSIHAGAIHKEKTQALLQMVSSNYALLVFDLVERAKRQLSSVRETTLSVKNQAFSLEERITRSRFEQAIRREYAAVREGLEATIARSGLKPENINRVIRTGGSSQIPLFVRLLNDVFGPEKVQAIDIFSSVTSGLAIRGHEIAGGDVSLKGYTPESVHQSEEMAEGSSKSQEVIQKSQEVIHVNLDSVKHRIQVTQEFREGQARLPEAVFLVMDEQRVQVFASENSCRPGPELPGALTGLNIEEARAAVKAVFSGIDGQILMVTNQFKLILAQVQALFIAQQASQDGIRDILRLEPGETVTALTPWDPAGQDKRFVCLVTRYGQARSFEARLLADSLTKRPEFQLERRYVGNPVSLLPAGENDMLLIGSSSGRAARLPVKDTSIMTSEVLKARKDEGITAAAVFAVAEFTGELNSAAEPLLAVGENGAILAFQPEKIPTDPPPAARGLTLRKNFKITAFLTPQQAQQKNFFALTSQARLLPIHLPSEIDTAVWSSPYKALKLRPGEVLLTCFEVNK